MDRLLQDLRYALRNMAHAPGFTAAIVLSLALGIGANTAVFSVLDSAFLRALPVAAPDRLVQASTDRGGDTHTNFSYPHYVALRERGPFTAVTAHVMSSFAVRVGDVTEQLEGAAVSGNFFDVLAVAPLLGRSFGRDEDVPRAARNVIVISHSLWQRRFGGLQEALGQRLLLNGTAFTIIGVASREFSGIVRGQPQEFWLPVTAWLALQGSNDVLERPTVAFLDVLARLPAGVTLAQAQARLTALDPVLREQQLLGADHRNTLAAAAGGLNWAVASLKRPLEYMLVAVALVLLIACANVASLLLARASARRRELALRLALGGSRRRIAQQLLTDAVLLAAVAGACGILLASWIADALAHWPTAVGAVAIQPTVNARVLAFTVAVTTLTGVLFGIVPAWQAARADVMPVLQERGARPAVVTARSTLVIAQVALSLMLLVSATLLARTMRNLADVDVGYATRDALLADIDLDAQRYEPARGRAFLNELLTRLRALPGVTAATAATTIAPSLAGSRINGVELEGYAGAVDDVAFDYTRVDRSYFDVLGIPLVAGRGFTDADDAASTPVVIINEEMARRYWPDQNPLAKRIFLSDDRTRGWVIVGVARGGKYRTLREEPTANVWRPLQQGAVARITLVVRTQGEPVAHAAAVSAEVRALDAGVPVFEPRSLRQHIAQTTSQERMAAGVAIAFSAVAVLLATLGIYGLLAFIVSQRRREIGIRMALGALRREVLTLVLRRGLLLTTIGILVGVPGAVFSTRLLRSLIYGVTAIDPGSYFAAAALLVTVACAAAFLPARRAAAVDPAITLREDAEA